MNTTYFRHKATKQRSNNKQPYKEGHFNLSRVIYTDKCMLFTLCKCIFHGQWNQCVDNGLFVIAIIDNKRRKWKVVGAAKQANY